MHYNFMMNKNIKYLGLLTMIPLFTVALTISYADWADATNVGTIGGPQDQTTKKYGSATKGIVCGDRLCSEIDTTTAKVEKVIIKDTPSHFPTIETVEAFQFDPEHAPHAYIDVLKVTAGDRNIDNIKIIIASDIDTIHTDIDGLFSGDDTTLITRIHALDPTTIVARITSYQFSE